ncbi:MAG: hypothetical protein ABWY00_05140 [Dongiaceae bacterium]
MRDDGPELARRCCRDAADDSSGGDLQLYRWRQRPRFVKRRMILSGDVDLARTVPYGPNCFVGFVNDSHAAHAVSPRSITPVPRRYINLIVATKFEVFALPQAGIWVQVLHFPQIRRTGYQSLGGDRQ